MLPGSADRTLLRNRLERNDWIDADVVLIKEMLPVSCHWMLQLRDDDA